MPLPPPTSRELLKVTAVAAQVPLAVVVDGAAAAPVAPIGARTNASVISKIRTRNSGRVMTIASMTRSPPVGTGPSFIGRRATSASDLPLLRVRATVAGLPLSAQDYSIGVFCEETPL